MDWPPIPEPEEKPAVAPPPVAQPGLVSAPAPCAPAPNLRDISTITERLSMKELLELADSQGASDLHIAPKERPLLRLDGRMRRVNQPPLTPEDTRDMVLSLMCDEQRRAFEATNDIDFSFQLGELARFRVNAFVQQHGVAAVFRRIPTKIKSIEDLGLPDVIRDLTKKERGLILVTGPTGSGKSTTLASMIDLINDTHEGHILTIEDPIEFVHTSKKCLISQREIGPHSNSFASALKAALREDPDIILVGEMRDLETIQLALTAAETGHLVFGTLHTSSAPKTIDRIIDVFPPVQQAQVKAMISESLVAVITQTLVPKKTGGRVAALEIMIATHAIKNLIREGKIHQIPSVMQLSQGIGMQTMEAHLKELRDRDLITPEMLEEKLAA